ncbi:hypothetical protein AAHD62_00335 [Enterobacter hormaechei]
MATTPTHAHALFTLPFNHSTAFTELADNCERFMDALVECECPAEKIALYGRLAACLALLQPTLLDPVPDAESVIQDLLSELVSFYADTLKMPRWLRTNEGVIELLA